MWVALKPLNVLGWDNECCLVHCVSVYWIAMSFSVAWNRAMSKTTPHTSSKAPRSISWLTSIHSRNNLIVHMYGLTTCSLKFNTFFTCFFFDMSWDFPKLIWMKTLYFWHMFGFHLFSNQIYLGDHTPAMSSWCTLQHVSTLKFFSDSCVFPSAMEQLVGPSGTGVEKVLPFLDSNFVGCGPLPANPSFTTLTGRGPHPRYLCSFDGKRKTNCGMKKCLPPFCGRESLSWFQRLWTYGESLGECFFELTQRGPMTNGMMVS